MGTSEHFRQREQIQIASMVKNIKRRCRRLGRKGTTHSWWTIFPRISVPLRKRIAIAPEKAKGAHGKGFVVADKNTNEKARKKRRALVKKDCCYKDEERRRRFRH